MPLRSGVWPDKRQFMAWLASMAIATSSMAISTRSPLAPLLRLAKAASTDTAAYMPVMMSTIGTPTFCGPSPGSPSGTPVTLINPPMAWIMKS
ncbi:hypothetical protein D3C87_1774190 [compost metagenome]